MDYSGVLTGDVGQVEALGAEEMHFHELANTDAGGMRAGDTVSA